MPSCTPFPSPFYSPLTLAFLAYQVDLATRARRLLDAFLTLHLFSKACKILAFSKKENMFFSKNQESPSARERKLHALASLR